MKLQDSKANCGPTALANALEAMGHVRSVEELAKLCDTNATHGTPVPNLLRAIKLLKEPCDLDDHQIIRTAGYELGSGGLFRAMAQGRAAVILVDAGEHYVSCFGTLGSRFHIADSADERLVVSVDDERLKEWWDSGGRYKHWAVIL